MFPHHFFSTSSIIKAGGTPQHSRWSLPWRLFYVGVKHSHRVRAALLCLAPPKKQVEMAGAAGRSRCVAAQAHHPTLQALSRLQHLLVFFRHSRTALDKPGLQSVAVRPRPLSLTHSTCTPVVQEAKGGRRNCLFGFPLHDGWPVLFAPRDLPRRSEEDAARSPRMHARHSGPSGQDEGEMEI